MPDVNGGTVKKLPDGFTYEGINQYGMPIYFYLGKPVYANNAAFPAWNTPVNFAGAVIPLPPANNTQPPNTPNPPQGGLGAQVAVGMFMINWLKLINGTGTGFGGPPPVLTNPPPPGTYLPTGVGAPPGPTLTPADTPTIVRPTTPTPPASGGFMQTVIGLIDSVGNTTTTIFGPGFFGPLVPGYDIPDSGGHVGT